MTRGCRAAAGDRIGAPARNRRRCPAEESPPMSAPRLAAASTALALLSACVVVPAPPPAPAVGGTVTPTGPAASQAGYCREYQQTVVIGGETQVAHGTSCLQSDGTWRLAGAPSGRRPPRPAPPPAAAPYAG